MAERLNTKSRFQQKRKAATALQKSENRVLINNPFGISDFANI